MAKIIPQQIINSCAECEGVACSIADINSPDCPLEDYIPETKESKQK